MKTIGDGISESDVRVTRTVLAWDIIQLRRTMQAYRAKSAQACVDHDSTLAVICDSRLSEMRMTMITLRGLSKCLRGF